jgi:hypothetical protein
VTKGQGRSGSRVSSKEVARAAVDGHKIIFTLADGSSVEGWACGMDDYHWRIITAEGSVVLVHKGSAMTVTITDESMDEISLSRYDYLIRPFRDWAIASGLVPPHLSVAGEEPQGAAQA